MSRTFLNLMREFEGMFGEDIFPSYNNLRVKYKPLNVVKTDLNSNLPSTNVFEDEWVYKFEIVTPGLTKEDLSIDINGDTLVFKGEKKEQSIVTGKH